MSTFLFDQIIFGPVKSRRLGISLGVNLMPTDSKICSFDCIYCECGYNKDHHTRTHHPSREVVSRSLESKLKEMHEQGIHPDVLTFAGNGEPTSHPNFDLIIDDTIKIRNKYCPEAKISVLSNSTFINHKKIHDALMRVDNNILKLDTVNIDYIRKVDRPINPSYNINEIIKNLKEFNGHVILQTMFMKGETDEGIDVNNTGEDFVGPWLDTIKEIAPKEVMIYTIDRETPDLHLIKATHKELDLIRDRVIKIGIPCTASY